MIISIHVSRLMDHLFYLLRERDEVYRLLDLLQEWECASMDVNESFFHRTRYQLKRQQDMINSRIDLLETLIEEFSRCIRAVAENLEEARIKLEQLD